MIAAGELREAERREAHQPSAPLRARRASEPGRARPAALHRGIFQTRAAFLEPAPPANAASSSQGAPSGARAGSRVRPSARWLGASAGRPPSLRPISRPTGRAPLVSEVKDYVLIRIYILDLAELRAHGSGHRSKPCPPISPPRSSPTKPPPSSIWRPRAGRMRSICPHCGSDQRPPHGRQDAGRYVPLQRLPRQVHGPHRHRHGAFAYPGPQVAAGDPSAVQPARRACRAHQLHRMLGVTYKSAWFLAHRIREAMEDDNPSPLGGEGKSVQADETYYGNTSKRAKGYKKGHSHKQQIVALVEPKGKVRAVHGQKATATPCAKSSLPTRTARRNYITDESRLYTRSARSSPLTKPLNTLGTARLIRRQRRPDHKRTSRIFSASSSAAWSAPITSASEQHLQRYVTEFEFRFNHRAGLGVNDVMRAEAVLKGIEGKRLTYRRPDEAQDGLHPVPKTPS